MQPRAVLAGVEGAGDPRAKVDGRTQADVRGLLAGVLVALLVASLGLPIGGAVVDRGSARRLVLPAESDDPEPGAFLLAAAEVREQTLAQWVLGAHPRLRRRLVRDRRARSPRAHAGESLSDTASRSVGHGRRGRRPCPRGDRPCGPPLRPERAGLLTGDAIVTIDGRQPVRQTLDLNLATGMTSRLRVYRGGQIVNLDLVPKAPWPQPAGGGATYVRRVLTSPPPVLELGKVRGGSAGLVLALAYVDVLTVGDLTGHRLIAATGALGPGGSVDPVLAYDAKVDALGTCGRELLPHAARRPLRRSSRSRAGRTSLVRRLIGEGGRAVALRQRRREQRLHSLVSARVSALVGACRAGAIGDTMARCSRQRTRLLTARPPSGGA